MKVIVHWEFEADVEDLDPALVDTPALAKDLTKRELDCLLTKGDLTADDFEYTVVI